MSSLFDIGKSAVQSYRQALAVTGQNIANVNTDGYKRREADLKEVGASSGSVTSTGNTAGLGVRVEDILSFTDSKGHSNMMHHPERSEDFNQS